MPVMFKFSRVILMAPGTELCVPLFYQFAVWMQAGDKFPISEQVLKYLTHHQLEDTDFYTACVN